MRSTLLRKLRREMDITQATLAERAGVSTAAVAAAERRRQVPKVDTALRIARAMGMSVEALFPELAPPSTPEPEVAEAAS